MCNKSSPTLRVEVPYELHTMKVEMGTMNTLLLYVCWQKPACSQRGMGPLSFLKESKHSHGEHFDTDMLSSLHVFSPVWSSLSTWRCVCWRQPPGQIGFSKMPPT